MQARTIGTATVFAVLSAPSLGAQAAEAVTERWECTDPMTFLSSERGRGKFDSLIQATRQGEFGDVSVAGVTHRARFQVQGFNRRWDFGDDFQYAFVIYPNGDGAYYDFTSNTTNVKPSQRFKCRQQ